MIENSPTNGYGAGGDGGDAAAASFEITGSQIEISDDSGEALFGIVVPAPAAREATATSSSYRTILRRSAEPGWAMAVTAATALSAELTLTGSAVVVSLSADDAVGILVSSYGGDGGSEGARSSGGWNEDPDEGANGGAGGDAGAVSVTMDSASTLEVTTTGAGGSMGAITLLSQGGDGGRGGDGGHYGDGNGGDGGTGGRVSGTMTTVAATTSGDDAYGIYLASLGGDGGTGSASDG